MREKNTATASTGRRSPPPPAVRVLSRRLSDDRSRPPGSPRPTQESKRAAAASSGRHQRQQRGGGGPTVPSRRQPPSTRAAGARRATPKRGAARTLQAGRRRHRTALVPPPPAIAATGGGANAATTSCGDRPRPWRDEPPTRDAAAPPCKCNGHRGRLQQQLPARALPPSHSVNACSRCRQQTSTAAHGRWRVTQREETGRQRRGQSATKLVSAERQEPEAGDSSTDHRPRQTKTATNSKQDVNVRSGTTVRSTVTKPPNHSDPEANKRPTPTCTVRYRNVVAAERGRCESVGPARGEPSCAASAPCCPPPADSATRPAPSSTQRQSPRRPPGS